MNNKLYDADSVQNIADAIRAKNKKTTKYKISEMAQAVKDISIYSDDDFLNIITGGDWEYTNETAFTDKNPNPVLDVKACAHLKTVNYPNATTLSTMSRNTGNEVIGLEKLNAPKCNWLKNKATQQLPNLKTINLAKTVYVDPYNFNKTGLEEITLNSPKVSWGTFSNNSDLRKVKITGKKEIDMGENLGFVTLSRNPLLKIIDLDCNRISGGTENSLIGDYNLKALVIRGKPTKTSANSFHHLLDYPDAYIYAEDMTLAEQMNWSRLKDRFKPLSEYDEKKIMALPDVSQNEINSVSAKQNAWLEEEAKRNGWGGDEE